MNARVAVFNDSSPDRHHGSFSVMSALDRGLRAEGLTPRLYWPVGRDWRPHRDGLARLGFDLLVVNGEGTIHDSRSRPAARWLAELGGFARETGARAVLLNATVHELEPDVLEALRGFDRVYVREGGSRRYLDGHGIEAAVTPDLSFFSVDRDGAAQSARSGFLVTDSVLAPVSEALDGVARETGAASISMLYGRGLSYRLRRRIERALSLPARRPARRITADPGFGAFIDRLGSAAGVLTGRFHAATLSLRMRAPMLAVESNTPKISYVLEDIFGSADRVVPRTRLENAAFRRTWMGEAAYSQGDLAAIDAYLAAGAKAKAAMFADIAALARGG